MAHWLVKLNFAHWRQYCFGSDVVPRSKPYSPYAASLTGQLPVVGGYFYRNSFQGNPNNSLALEGGGTEWLSLPYGMDNCAYVMVGCGCLSRVGKLPSRPPIVGGCNFCVDVVGDHLYKFKTRLVLFAITSPSSHSCLWRGHTRRLLTPLWMMRRKTSRWAYASFSSHNASL